MWEQNYTPVAGSLGLSTLVAAIPLVILFYMLGVRRKPGWVPDSARWGLLWCWPSPSTACRCRRPAHRWSMVPHSACFPSAGSSSPR